MKRKSAERRGERRRSAGKRERSGHTGSSFEDFLAEEGMLEEAEAVAIKRVIAWQIQEAMKRKSISKAEMAKRMKTSRPSVDRLLDPTHTSLTLATMFKAAKAIGGKIKVSVETDTEAVA